MKKTSVAIAIIILIIAMLSAIIVGCVKTDGTVPDYFLEPEGYVIAQITSNKQNVFYTQRWYGYIKKEDYNNYLSNELSGVLLVLNPYEEGKSIAVKSSEIGFIEIGLYQDLRNK